MAYWEFSVNLVVSRIQSKRIYSQSDLHDRLLIFVSPSPGPFSLTCSPDFHHGPPRTPLSSFPRATSRTNPPDTILDLARLPLPRPTNGIQNVPETKVPSFIKSLFPELRFCQISFIPTSPTDPPGLSLTDPPRTPSLPPPQRITPPPGSSPELPRSLELLCFPYPNPFDSFAARPLHDKTPSDSILICSIPRSVLRNSPMPVYFPPSTTSEYSLELSGNEAP